ncbi:MAG: NAD(P)/FAD-dependent oxidoreductase, partial [Rhodospirillales bacterium]
MNTFKETPYWWEEAEPQAADNGSPPEKADIIVVGGGFAGMGAAIPLARAGRSVVVLERDRPGDGASSRNGGITSGNLRVSFSKLVAKFGMEKAKAFYAEGNEARDDLKAFIENEKIDCDYELVGRFTGAMNAESLESMKREIDLLNRQVGIDAKIIERSEQSDEIGTELYHGGVSRSDIGGVHPGKMHRGMRKVAEESGVKIFGVTGVTDISRVGGQFKVTTPKGVIMASHVIVATNGYTDAGLPWLRR